MSPWSGLRVPLVGFPAHNRTQTDPVPHAQSGPAEILAAGCTDRCARWFVDNGWTAEPMTEHQSPPGKPLQVAHRAVRSPLYRWLYDRHDELLAACPWRVGNWQAICDQAIAQGILSGDGTPPTRQKCKRIWPAVCYAKEVERQDALALVRLKAHHAAEAQKAARVPGDV